MRDADGAIVVLALPQWMCRRHGRHQKPTHDARLSASFLFVLPAAPVLLPIATPVSPAEEEDGTRQGGGHRAQARLTATYVM